MKRRTKNLYDHKVKAAGWISLIVGLALLAIKFTAYSLTGSSAVLSDALESIVNVIAAVVGLTVLHVASKPADRDHPYGHGKIEYVSAAFEGGLILFAAILIVYTAVQKLFEGAQVERIDIGLGLVAAAGLVNLAVGFSLRKIGRQYGSLALVASGAHLFSDFWTSLVVVVALIVVKITSIPWIDPLFAGGVAIWLGYTGVRLLGQSISGLMDAEDENVIEKLRSLFIGNLRPGVISLHYTRVIRSGPFHHVDAHVVVPEFWDVQRAHEILSEFENDVISGYEKVGRKFGELHLHMDPCRSKYCQECPLENCPIRAEVFVSLPNLGLTDLVSPTT